MTGMPTGVEIPRWLDRVKSLVDVRGKPRKKISAENPPHYPDAADFCFLRSLLMRGSSPNMREGTHHAESLDPRA